MCSWRQIWQVNGRESGFPELLEVPGLPRKFPKLPRKFFGDFTGILTLCNLTAIQGFPGSFPDFPGSSPDLPAGSRTFPEVSPFFWEADTLS